MQAADPLAVAGFLKHSDLFSDPAGRLQRTDKQMSSLYFGNEREVHKTARTIRRAHSRVIGYTENDYGPVKAGTPYSAEDPELLLWVLATLADSALLYYDNLVSELDQESQQLYWNDMIRLGHLLGLPQTIIPNDVKDMRAYVADRKDDLYLSEEMRGAALGIIFTPPFEGIGKVALLPLTETVEIMSIGFLPNHIRDLYKLDWNPIKEKLFRASCWQIKYSLPLWLPSIRNHPFAK